jgi:hypothetical protein
MQHDEQSLVREAHAAAKQQVETTGHVLPAAYLLTRVNPQTGAELTYPTAIASVFETPLQSQDDMQALVQSIKDEAKRLRALAVVFCAEAEVQLDDAGRDLRRVAMLRVEDQGGVQLVHAEIVAGETGFSLGPLMTTNVDELPNDEAWLVTSAS